MSEPKAMIAPENVPTIAAVALVLAMLAFAYTAYVHRQVYHVAVGTVALEVKDASQEKEAYEAKIKLLEDRLAAVEGKMAATTTASAEPAAPAEPAAAPAPQ